MSDGTVIKLCAAVAAAISSIALAQSRSPAQSRPAVAASTLPADHYNVVVDRNIFVRERRRPVIASTRPTSRTTQPPASLESLLVLRGVVLEDGLFRAYFENTERNELVRVAAGDAIARGHVAEISIDAVEFEGVGGAAWIKIGDNLAGGRVAAPPPSAMASTSRPAGGGDLSAVAERMRRAREQRSGGGR